MLGRRRIALIAVALAALLTMPAVRSVSAASPGPILPAASCGQGSWVAGTVDVCDGELVYRDYIYDDHGATLTPFVSGPLEGLYAYRPFLDAYGQHPPMGAADAFADVLPIGRDNTADLVALRLRVTDDQLTVTAELNTMFDSGITSVTVGIDTDDDSATRSGGTWPNGVLASSFLGVVAQPLGNYGLDTFLTLTGGDSAINQLTTTVPRPTGSRWRLQAVTARPVPGSSGPVAMNVAFRGPIERGGWFENAQALALANNDISAFAHTVEVADLAGGVTRPAVVEPGLVYQRVYISDFIPAPGEGVGNPGAVGPGGGLQGFTMMGRYQPYGFYQPPGDGPFGLQLGLHGLGENHATMLWDQALFTNPPNFAIRFGEDLNRIIATPLGRGWRGFYSSYAERDVLDVLDDVEANYPIDTERVLISGLSMGGYGAMRIAALHPDRFAAVVQWVGYTGDLLNGTPLAGTGLTGVGAVGNVVDLLGNLRHVPMGALYSTTDELIHVNEALAVRSRLAELHQSSMFWLKPAGNHGIDYLLNDWSNEAEWSAGRTRVLDPPHVAFRTDQRFFFPELGITPDRAHWVSAIVPAGPGYADVDAITYGCGTGDPVTTTTETSGTKPVPWLGQDIHVVGVTERPAANRLELTLTNVASLTVDSGNPAAAPGSRGACLSAAELTYHVVTDRPTTITFTDGRSLVVPAGAHDGVVAPLAASQPESFDSASVADSVTPAGQTPGRSLPATGGDLPLWLPLLLAAAAAALGPARRRLQR